MEAEYENWLLDETHKCERVGSMLGDESGKGKKDGEVEAWVRGYCGDCERALGGVRTGRERGLI